MKVQLTNLSDEEVFELLGSRKKSVARDAFEELYGRYSTKIYNYCRKILNNENSTSDAFQETFLKVIEASKEGKVMTNFAGYIIRVARNLCLNEKENIRNTMIYVEDLQLLSTQLKDDKELNEIISVALDSLPFEYRECLILKEFLNFSYNEIAEMLDTTMPIVRIRIHRAKEKLKDLLAPYSNEVTFLLE